MSRHRRKRCKKQKKVISSSEEVKEREKAGPSNEASLEVDLTEDLELTDSEDSDDEGVTEGDDNQEELMADLLKF